jgi:hypothetical protein
MQSKRTSAAAKACACGLVLIAAGAARADTVLDFTYSLSSGSIGANDAIGSHNSASRTITSLPLVANDIITVGANAASTTYNLSGTAFDLGFTHSRTGTLGSHSESSGSLYFTPTDNSTSYALSGNYTFTSPYAQLHSNLIDVGTGISVFSDDHTYNDSGLAGGTFTVGGTQGQYNSPPVALSGALIAGHHYHWVYDVYIQAYPNADSGAIGSGRLTLSFSDSANAPAATPLPSAALGGLVLLGGLSAGGLGRRSRWFAAV